MTREQSSEPAVPLNRGQHSGAPTPLGSDDALTRVREAMASATGLLAVAEAAAREIAVIMSAWEVTITLLDGQDYWDIVDLADHDDGYPLFPDHRYPLSSYPLGTERMLSGKGYISGDGSGAVDEVMTEFKRQWPEVTVGSLMAVPIVALGGVHGEIFLVRQADTAPFLRDDLDLMSELATLFGARLPALVSAYVDVEDAAHPATMPQLTHQLRELLKDATGDEKQP